jgi:hypothetical protein
MTGTFGPSNSAAWEGNGDEANGGVGASGDFADVCGRQCAGLLQALSREQPDRLLRLTVLEPRPHTARECP